MLESLTSLGTGLAAFCACLILRAALEWHVAVTRGHNAECRTCPQHRRRDPKVVGAGRKKRRSANG